MNSNLINNYQVIFATASYDRTIRFWDADTGGCLKFLQHNDSVSENLLFLLSISLSFILIIEFLLLFLASKLYGHTSEQEFTSYGR